jgi:hypothetical protein
MEERMIKLENVASVYSGIDGRCCCGCSGKHTYASAHQAWGSKNRGYKVEDDQVSDRTVKMVVNKIDRAVAAGVKPYDHDPKELVSVTLGRRLYIAYMKH